MECKSCGHHNARPRFEPVLFPLDFKTSVSAPKNETATALPVRWACEKCGRFHFRDGTLYDPEKARKMHEGRATD